MMRSRTMLWCWVSAVLATTCFLSWRIQAATESKPSDGTNVVGSAEEESNEMQAIHVLRRMGHYDEAEARCRRVLEQKSNDPAVKRLLAEIQSERRQQQNSWIDLEHKIEGIVIPEVNVHEASVIEVIDFLTEQCRILSGEKVPVNVVWQAPEGAKTVKVTLNLREVPFTEALKFVTESSGLRYRVDAHAIVIYRPSPATPPNAKP